MPSWLCAHTHKKKALSGLLKEIENYGVNVAHHGQFNGTCDFFHQFYLRGKLSVVIKPVDGPIIGFIADILFRAI